MALINSYASISMLKKLFPAIEDFNKIVIEKPRNWRSINDRADLYGDNVSKFLSEASSDFNMGWGTVLTIPGFNSDRSGYVQLFLPASTVRTGGTLIYRISQSSSMKNGWTDWFELVTDKKADKTYWKKETGGTVLVTLDPVTKYYHQGAGLLTTKRGDLVTLTGDLLHGDAGMYKIVGKVGAGYEPIYDTVVSGMYSRNDGTYGYMPMIVNTKGEIIQMDIRRNQALDNVNTKISGTWQTKY